MLKSFAKYAIYTITFTVLATSLSVYALPFVAGAFPVTVSRTSFTENGRVIVIQGMVHVASDAFYNDIKQYIDQRYREGWIILYEELKDEPQSGAGKLSTPLHPFQPLLKILGSGATIQDNRFLLPADGPLVINADLTLKELLSRLHIAPHNSDADHVVEPCQRQAASLSRQTPTADCTLETLPIQRASNDVVEPNLITQFESLHDFWKDRVSALAHLLMALPIREMALEWIPPDATRAREAIVVEEIARHSGANVLVVYGDGHAQSIIDQLSNNSKSVHSLESTKIVALRYPNM
ncbi:hypothetical protein [Azospirillum rugosum]|uniref:Haem-binding uptake, Tiki superfamily, ChaN n=1 Tax=Azospirillum rugosum TaxID=416170 RepID=A0ABS4SXG7_9PROT|nr:hypothetical protein [Azospirillum rugosum]MBP2297256.1 hypothetical protein [Azospirillum rugosum]MDQ0531109.1 hypothetical protein [Azospirillum rugosum]